MACSSRNLQVSNIQDVFYIVSKQSNVLSTPQMQLHRVQFASHSYALFYCRNAMVACARETRKVLESLLDVISKELRLVPTYFRNVFGDFEQTLRVNYYPPCPQPELVLGLRTHTDPIVLTALLEDQTRGLQVKNGDKWVTVDPEPDALVIFVGDQLQVNSSTFTLFTTPLI